VRKSYGELEAVAGIDLEVSRGEVFAMLGPNGAGKTTTVEILEGYRLRNGGEVEVLGEDPARAGAAWRAQIGIVPQGTGAFEVLTVAELVHHFSHFYEHALDPDETIELVGLTEKRDSRLSTLSGGQQRRVDLALGIVGDPELVFLDEPTTGLDPQARRQVWALVERMTGFGKTVLLTTHYLDEAEALADRVASSWPDGSSPRARRATSAAGPMRSRWSRSSAATACPVSPSHRCPPIGSRSTTSRGSCASRPRSRP
jgi:ABC-2 type transport system ATP-binding protein